MSGIELKIELFRIGNIIYELDMNVLFPFMPLIPYFVLFVFTLKAQLKSIPDRIHEVLDKRMTTNLTLVGLSFAVINLLVTLFKDNLDNIYYPIYFFSISLAYFLCSYIVLHLRIRRAFEFISDVFTNSGLWTIIWGLLNLFYSFNKLKSISLLFVILLLIFGFYIIVDLRLKCKMFQKEGKEMVKRVCPKCKEVLEAEIIKKGITPTDIGQVKCPLCKSIWCYCERHGTYECPPPCPKCGN